MMKDVSLKTYHLSVSRPEVLPSLPPGSRWDPAGVAQGGEPGWMGKGRQNTLKSGIFQGSLYKLYTYPFRGDQKDTANVRWFWGDFPISIVWVGNIMTPVFWAVQYIWVCDKFFKLYVEVFRTWKTNLFEVLVSRCLSCSFVFGDDEPSFDKYVYVETKSFFGGETPA